MSGARDAITSLTFSIPGLMRGRVQGPEAITGPVERELVFFKDSVPGEGALDLDVTLARGGADNLLGPHDGDRSVPATEWEGRHLVARWRAAMSHAGSGPATLHFSGNWPTRFIVSKWIVEPAIRVVMEGKGAAMAHAAALSDGARAVLVAGAGGAGKTTWSLAWIGAGHPYMSDDFTVVNGGKALPYVTPMRLGLMNLMSGEALSGLPAVAKAEIAVRTLLRRASLGRLKLYYKAMPQAAVTGLTISGAAEIAGAVWIEGGPRSSDAGAREISGDEMAARMAEIDRAEMHGFGGSAGEGTVMPPGFWDTHRARLADALRGKPCVGLAGRVLPPAEARGSVTALMEWAKRRGGR